MSLPLRNPLTALRVQERSQPEDYLVLVRHSLGVAVFKLGVSEGRVN